MTNDDAGATTRFGGTNSKNDEEILPDFADPSELYAPYDDHMQAEIYERTDENMRAKPPKPAAYAPPKPRKPPVAVAPNASFLRPTVTSEIRRSIDASREKSAEFIRQAK